MVAGAAAADRRRADGDRRRPGDRPADQLSRAPFGRGPRRRLPAQRKAVLLPAGAGAGLLAGVTPGRAHRGGAGRRGPVDQGTGLQRRPDPPEGGGSALPLLGRPARVVDLGRDGERLRLQRAGGEPVHPGVARRGPPRPVAPVRRRLGPAERELGRARHRRRAGPAALRDRALPPDQGAGSDPAGDLQRRLGAHRIRHLVDPRLHAGSGQPHRQVRHPGGADPQPHGEGAEPSPGADRRSGNTGVSR